MDVIFYFRCCGNDPLQFYEMEFFKTWVCGDMLRPSGGRLYSIVLFDLSGEGNGVGRRTSAPDGGCLPDHKGKRGDKPEGGDSGWRKPGSGCTVSIDWL